MKNVLQQLYFVEVFFLEILILFLVYLVRVDITRSSSYAPLPISASFLTIFNTYSLQAMQQFSMFLAIFLLLLILIGVDTMQKGEKRVSLEHKIIINGALFFFLLFLTFAKH